MFVPLFHEIDIVRDRDIRAYSAQHLVLKATLQRNLALLKLAVGWYVQGRYECSNKRRVCQYIIYI